MAARHKFIKIALPICILLVGLLVARGLISSRQPPRKSEASHPGALVEVLQVRKEDRAIVVHGTGTVQAAQEISVTMQVSGMISEMAPAFVAGGLFKKGELLFAVEPVDYELGVERARAVLAREESALALTEGKAMVARREWDRLHPGEPANPLVVYTPQLKDALANLQSARAAVKQAELDLQRTRIVAPFDCRVRSEQVAIGQYVRTGTSVAQLAASDVVEILIPLPLEELPRLQIPLQPGGEGSPVLIEPSGGGMGGQWRGTLVRSLGEADPKSRMVQVVARVAMPEAKRSRNVGETLMPGMFVNLALTGSTLEGIVVLPVSSLRDNSTVWVMDENDTLRTRAVEVVRLERDVALIRSGLAAGERVVLTGLSGGAEGMRLRVSAREADK